MIFISATSLWQTKKEQVDFSHFCSCKGSTPSFLSAQLQDVSESFSGWEGDSDHHHLKPQQQMANALSDPGFSVQSNVCRGTARKSEDDGLLYSTWGETWKQTLQLKAKNKLHDFCLLFSYSFIKLKNILYICQFEPFIEYTVFSFVLHLLRTSHKLSLLCLSIVVYE